MVLSSVKEFGLVGITDTVKLAYLVQNGFAQYINIGAFQGGNEEGVSMRQVLPPGFQVLQDLVFGSFIQPFIKCVFYIKIHFVKEGDNRLFKGLELLKGLVYHPYL